MFRGIRAKNKKTVTVMVDYTVHIQEIKSWSSLNSLKTLRSIVIHWENGDHSSGFTKSVVAPSKAEKIEFNESFELHVPLVKVIPLKGSRTEVFHKNVLELNLYEPRNNILKGHLIGSATIDLAQHGVIKKDLNISVPINFKRSYRNTSQPVLFVKIQPFKKYCSDSSSKGSLSKDVSSENDGKDSVSELMSEEYAEEAEIASFTDEEDDLSRSSLDNSASASETNILSPQRGPDEQLHPKNDSEIVNKRSGLNNTEADLHLESVPEAVVKPASETYSTDVLAAYQSESSSHSSSADFDHKNCEEGECSPSDLRKQKHAVCTTGNRSFGRQDFSHRIETEHTSANILSSTKSTEIDKPAEEMSCLTSDKPEASNNEVPLLGKGGKKSEEVSSRGDIQKVEENIVEKHDQITDNQNHSVEMKSLIKNSPDNVIHQQRNLQSALQKSMISNTFTRRMPDEWANNALNGDRTKHAKSVRLSPDTVNNNVPMSSKLLIEGIQEVDVPVAASDDSEQFAEESVMYDQMNSSMISEVKHASPYKIQELELKVRKLQEELIETAVIESALYSIVAEHGSSAHKVHTPARRLSRLYFHAYKNWSLERKANAVKSAVSGLILTARACGNDIPRLTFWLSNTVMLRAIISSGPDGKSNVVNVGAKRNRSQLKWKTSVRQKSFSLIENFSDWEDPKAVTEALEKIEAWMFSRITDSVWWQVLTPYMHPGKENDQLKLSSRSSRLCNQQQSDSSLYIWIKAFKETCGRLCPIRAAGLECGCLPMLPRLVMKHCVARLDLAMFNAILRESEDDIPSNPVSDPISDLKVLPIPVGQKCVGAGLQLKNTVGAWSRWLSDMLDVDESPENEKERDSDVRDYSASSKSFSLLNSVSDILMIPKDMLLDDSIRKEICPTFSGPLIKQILESFVPDELCPDPIPPMVLEALESEDPMATSELAGSISLDASQIVYSPPSVASILSAVGDAERQTLMKKSGSSVIRKCHTSDDELDELASPFTTLVMDMAGTDASKPEKEIDPNVVRYELLREIWCDDTTLDI